MRTQVHCIANIKIRGEDDAEAEKVAEELVDALKSHYRVPAAMEQKGEWYQVWCLLDPEWESVDDYALIMEGWLLAKGRLVR